MNCNNKLLLQAAKQAGLVDVNIEELENFLLNLQELYSIKPLYEFKVTKVIVVKATDEQEAVTIANRYNAWSVEDVELV